MLVVSRKKNESILINDVIEVVVVEIRGDKVRLGIVTPRDVPVHRREVFDALRQSEVGRVVPDVTPKEPDQPARDTPSSSPSHMLVLSRKKNESVVINDDITVVVVEIQGDKVRLDVGAPPPITPHRREVWEAMRRNEQAGKTTK